MSAQSREIDAMLRFEADDVGDVPNPHLSEVERKKEETLFSVMLSLKVPSMNSIHYGLIVFVYHKVYYLKVLARS
jgi:hypothetical protein